MMRPNCMPSLKNDGCIIIYYLFFIFLLIIIHHFGSFVISVRFIYIYSDIYYYVHNYYIFTWLS